MGGTSGFQTFPTRDLGCLGALQVSKNFTHPPYPIHLKYRKTCGIIFLYDIHLNRKDGALSSARFAKPKNNTNQVSLVLSYTERIGKGALCQKNRSVFYTQGYASFWLR